MQSSPLIVSVSGIRGIVGASLTPEVAMEFAAAFGTPLAGRSVVLARDGRATGLLLRDAVAAGLMGAGCHVLDLGIASTPTCGFNVKTGGHAGGIQITASHNPPEWNGLKLFRPEGFVLSPAAGQKVSGAYHRREKSWAAWNGVGALSSAADPFAPHLAAVLAAVDVEAIRRRRFKVILDCNHGSGGTFGPRLLETLGCQVEVLGGTPDGRFAHPPEPTEANLAEVAARMAGADVGFAVDPDADRLALIDEHGRYIGEELTLALAILHITRRRPGPVVLNGSTSLVSETIARRAGCPVFRTPVGEVHVAERMIAEKAVIGGEGNGGVIDPRIGFGRDSAIGMALTLDLLAAEGKPLSAVVAPLPAFAIRKDKATVEKARLPAIFEGLAARFPEAQADREDGLRLSWEDAWLQVRASNTEPIIRIIAEAADPARADALTAAARELAG